MRFRSTVLFRISANLRRQRCQSFLGKIQNIQVGFTRYHGFSEARFYRNIAYTFAMVEGI